MRVLVAFDKFKDALTAREACEVAARVLHDKHPDWQIDLCPLSDGGDGFEEILSRVVTGTRIPLQVTGPRGSLVEAGFTLVSESQIPIAARSLLPFTAQGQAESNLAIIEMATASGLALLAPSQRTPWETTSRGTGTRLINPALSTMYVVPVLHATVKKLKGTRPHSTNTGKFDEGFLKIFVKTKVITSIMTDGFSSDQNTPRDMFRYLIRKSLRIRFFITKRKSPCHTATSRSAMMETSF